MNVPITQTPAPAAAFPWHALPVERVAQELHTDLEHGLRPDALPPPAVTERLAASRGASRILLNQLKGGVILVLLAATALMLALGHLGDAAAIGASVLLSVVFGFATDFRAERALEALRDLTAPTALVLRGGLAREIPASELRAGDLLVLSAGQLVAADGRVVEARDLQLDESALTGESLPITKRSEPVDDRAVLADRADMAYAGTTVVGGSGHLLVTGAGAGTELARIGRLVTSQRREETPLERQVEQLGRRLALLAIGLSALVTGLGLLRGVSFWLMVETGVLLAIAAIPEGLPAVTTIALAVGVRRMARAEALVRRLSSVETLGSATVICTDKTGTITENVMRVTRVRLPEVEIEVTGAGYAPHGSFLRAGAPVDPKQVPGLERLLQAAAVCNDARLESHEGWHVHGLPTEGALLALAGKGQLDVSGFTREAVLGFSSARKRMTVLARAADGTRWAFVKGAPEVLLPRVTRVLVGDEERPIDPPTRARLTAEASALGEAGFRVLALACRTVHPLERPESSEEALTWLGLVGLIDPPRAGVREAIAQLRGAGIRTVMITGDQKATAMAVAKELGLAQADELCLDSKELAAAVAERRFEVLRQTAVFARVTPEDKLTIVRALRDAGQIIAMTGDGINDAPALKAAHIGIAIGRASADVARASSDLVVVDGDYATLPRAVSEGRQIYANIRRSIHYLLLCSLATIGVMLVAVVTDLPLPMSPLQLLWLNLVIHIFPAMALVLVPGETGVLNRPPRLVTEPILTWKALGLIALRAALVAGTVLWSYAAGGGHEHGARGQTLVMATLALVLLVQTLSTLTESGTAWSARRSLTPVFWLAIALGLGLQALAIWWPPLASVLLTAPLSGEDLLRIGLMAVLVLLVVEAAKVFATRRGG